MSGNSNVGNAGVYQADDQRTVKDSEIEEQKKENRFHEGKENSHKALDSSMWSTYRDRRDGFLQSLHAANMTEPNH